MVYARIPRAPTRVIHDPGVRFEYGKGYWLRQSKEGVACLVTSGRGICEALEAARLLEKEGSPTAVMDMPSLDEELIGRLYEGTARVILVEQNNGFLLQGFQSIEPGRTAAINVLDAQGQPRFIHSATYAQLLDCYGLSPAKIALRVKRELRRPADS